MSSMSRAGLDHLHRVMAAKVDSGELPGLVYLVAHGDEVHAEAVGSLAFGGAAPMRRDTVFRIASLTKPLLAAAAMMLVDEGRLPLDAPVDRWLPELADRRVLRRVDGELSDTVPAGRAVTVADLLTYRMGYGMIVEPSFDPPYPVVTAAAELDLVMGPPDPRTPHDPDEWIRRFGTLPLMNQPGEMWRYNVSALVLSVLVARAAGRPLGDFFAERLFQPLGMAHTGFQLPARWAGELPGWYMTNFATGEREPQTSSPVQVWTRPPVFPSGAAGLVSTVDDYFAFAQLLRGGGEHRGRRLLSGEAVRLMTTNVLTDEQIARGGAVLGGRGWGYGMSVAVRPDEVSDVPGRYGWEGGYGTSWFNHPQLDLVAILMTQVSDVLFNGTLTEFGRAATAVAGAPPRGPGTPGR
jgi:CubicO group peptidase (beta-lactamase class C family)